MEIPEAVPVMVLPGATLFPQEWLPLRIFESRYRRMLDSVLQGPRIFAVAMQRPGTIKETPCQVAGLGLIRASVEHDDSTSHLVLQGLTRVRLGKITQSEPFLVHTVKPVRAKPDDSVRIDALQAKVRELVEERLQRGVAGLPTVVPPEFKVAPGKPKGLVSVTPDDLLVFFQRLTDAGQLADVVTCTLLSKSQDRQLILESIEVEQRLRRLIRILLADLRRQT